MEERNFEFYKMFITGVEKYNKQEYDIAIYYFEKAVEYNPPIVYSSIATCHYEKAQGLLLLNNNAVDEDVIMEYQKAYSNVNKALEYNSTDKLDLMHRNLLAGITSGALNLYYKANNISNTISYLTIAANLGSLEAISLLNDFNSIMNDPNYLHNNK